MLDKTNLAIARNCDANIDKKNGAEAKNWKKGKPIRVIRSAKLKKHSKYAPEIGNRYDGIYKVVKYWWVFATSEFWTLYSGGSKTECVRYYDGPMFLV